MNVMTKEPIRADILARAASKLIVAADYDIPNRSGGIEECWEQILGLADQLRNTGVCFKVGGGPALGWRGGLHEITERRHLDLFLDIKVSSLMLEHELVKMAAVIRTCHAKFVTIMASPSTSEMQAFIQALSGSGTQVLGVAVPTNWTEEKTRAHHKCSIREAFCRIVPHFVQAGGQGMVCAPSDIDVVRKLIGPDKVIVTPNIRWGDEIEGDNQNRKRSMTPTEAVEAGADYLVVGKPIWQANDPLATVKQVIHEIAVAMCPP